MTVSFRKMHGAGNDFVVLDVRAADTPTSPALAAALSDRATGIGCDQFITLLPPTRENGAHLRMQIQNADGTPAGACGNATRCVADLIAQETGLKSFSIETISGILACDSLAPGRARVAMGVPKLNWQEIPLAKEVNTLHLPLPGDPAAASMGNPHITFFVPDLDAEPILARGPALQENPLFPGSVNVGFAQVIAPDRLRLRVYERGAGLTRACGSGACATLVNAHRRGFTGRYATIEADGGTLEIEWRESDGQVLMTGPAVIAFTGEFDPGIYPP